MSNIALKRKEVGYFLARFGLKREGLPSKPPTVLNEAAWSGAYDLFFEALGDGQTRDEFRNSLNNYRDAFDHLFPDNNRQGWKLPLTGELKAVFDGFKDMGHDEVWGLVSRNLTAASKGKDLDNGEEYQRFLSILKEVGLRDARELFEIIHELLGDLEVRQGDERVTFSLPRGKRSIGLTIGQRNAIVIERKKKQTHYLHINSSQNSGVWLREVNSLNDIRSNRSALLHNIKAEIEGTNRSGFRESGSLAFEKAIFDLNYRKQVFTDAFGDNDDQALLEVLVGGRALTELNQIFYGPPGTGKTFHTINAAIEIIDPFLYRNKGGDRAALQKRFQELRISEGEHKEGQIGFTTFHQSMSYEDFIEGIKPSSPKEGDSYLKYDVEEGIFKKMCRLAAANEEKNYVLIIDEINRGNVSAIFGELITLVEPNKRAGAEESLGIVLPYSKAIFSVPKNLHIIGTMNTADRSVEALDSALRRRFAFKEMAPDPDVIAAHGKLAENNGVLEEGRLKVNLPELLKTINGRIELLRDKDCLIGHSYLMEVKTLEDLRRAFLDKIIPLLQEYFFADLGKLSLILGPSFVEVVNDKEVSFAKGHDYDQLLVNELQERKVYRLTSPDIWDFEQILA